MSDYIIKPPASLPPGSVVIAYLRDSGGPNQEDSKDQQEKVITSYCQEHGLILNKIYSDTASGRRVKKRDQFVEMVNTVMTCPDDLRPAGLILWAYSRFSRDIIDFNFYLYGLLRRGIVIHSLTEEIPEGLTGQIMLSIKAYTNADFSIQLGKQIKRGIAERVKEGYNNGGHAPRGYRIVREYQESARGGHTRIGIKWEIDPELAPLVRMAWELRAIGKGYAEIIRATAGRLYTSKNSMACHFRNKSYLGIGKAGELEVPDHHEPLVTQELWDAVKRVEEAAPRYGMKGNPLHPKRIKHPSLLSGLAWCIYCGSAMILHTDKKYRSYACGSRERQRFIKSCADARRVNAPKAESRILDVVLNRILSDDFLTGLVDEIKKQLMDTSKLDQELGEITNALILIDRSINRLMKLAEGTGDLDEISNRLKELKKKKTTYTQRIKELKSELAAQIPDLTPEALAIVFNTWRKQIQNATQSGDILSAKKMISQFVSRIELGHKSAKIHYTYPLAIPARDGQKDMSLSAHN